MDRRQFLIGLFGTAAVVAAGPLPKVLEQLSERDFAAAARAAIPVDLEIYGDDKGNYGFAKIEYLDQPPYFKVTIPDGFRPLRAESDRIETETLARFKKEFPQ